MKLEGEVLSGCYTLYKEWLSKSDVSGIFCGNGVYTCGLIVWLMMYQRLKCGGSLSETVEAFSSGAFIDIAGECKRTRENRISSNTGGYSLARRGLSLETVSEVSDSIFERLRAESEPSERKYGRPVYALDGATIEVSRTKEISRKYPPCENGYYPMIRMIVCHDLETGLAVRPEYGALNGKHLKSEVQLVRQMFSRLPDDGVFIGDRAYGIFSVAHCADALHRDVIFRLTEQRARKVLGEEPRHGVDKLVKWDASHHDRAKNSEFGKNTAVEGRVLCMNVKSYTGGKETPLYLFTTLKTESAEFIIEMYGLRWNIEVDIRSLKKTASMELLRVRSVAMAEKELILGVSAYNLVIAVRRAAAKRLGLAPRSLSFKRIMTIVDIYAPLIANASGAEREEIIARFWRATKAAKHPRRKKPRVEPRAIVRNKRSSFPTMKGSRNDARKKILNKN